MSDEEVADRVRADEQDAALFLVAAFTGLRLGELIALRWRHVDFADAKLMVEASWSTGRLTTPKSRKWRAVPLADQPAAVLDQLSQRALFTGRDDLVFCSAVGDYLAKITTTERYLHARSRRTDAARMTKAFAGEADADVAVGT